MPGVDLVESTCIPPGSASPTSPFAEYHDDLRRAYEAVAHGVRLAGGPEKVAARMNRKPSYGNKIGEALSRDGDLRVQLDHIMAIARIPEAIAPLLALLSEIGMHEPPVRSREFEEDDVMKAKAEALDELAEDEDFCEIARRKVARKLGVRPERVKFRK